MAKKFVSFLTGVTISFTAHSLDIAACHSPKGKSNFPTMGLVPVDKSGWKDDAITGGRYTLTKQGADFDLLYLDSNKRLASSKGNGATVSLIRMGSDNFSIFVYYPNDTIEIFSFMRETTGALSLHVIQSKGGDAPVHKSSILTARCDFINFEAVN